MAYTLEQTPTWAVAAVCTLIVLVSLVVERLIHLLGRKLKEKKQKPLFEALEKMKEELMVMGFISLLLTVFQSSITNLCMPGSWAPYMLPCAYNATARGITATPDTVHHRRLLIHDQLEILNMMGGGRKLLARAIRRLAAGETATSTCSAGKVNVISLEGLHQLHIFIFVMTVVHVGYCCVTVFLGFYKMHGWSHWEEETRAENYDSVAALQKTFKLSRTKTYVASQKAHPLSTQSIISWLVSFFRQFGSAVVKEEYLTLRLGFITTHNLTNKFDFHGYIRRTLEDDFKVVVGISSFLWAFVVIFLLLNVNNWYTYFWIAFAPVIMILVVGTKLQHIIQQLSLETAQLQGVIGVALVKARDSLFWFNRPQILLYLIHFILFQNAFELSFFFWILTTFGFDSCVMGKSGLVIVRLVMGIGVQVLCSYSTLPLYALVTQMGTHYKKAIFQENTAQAIHGWHHKAKKNLKKGVVSGQSKTGENAEESVHLPLTASSPNDGTPVDNRVELFETQGRSELGSHSDWDAETRPLRESDAAELYALEVPDPADSLGPQNQTQNPSETRMTWLRVKNLVMTSKHFVEGGASGHPSGND